mmetsp:Transcript_11301/g.17858  ORF Transcript_11301/g.17858 Transcript_11301/m.17858 type:complete len:100 (+) Transcript_11301:1105-1404(+)
MQRLDRADLVSETWIRDPKLLPVSVAQPCTMETLKALSGFGPCCVVLEVVGGEALGLGFGLEVRFAMFIRMTLIVILAILPSSQQLPEERKIELSTTST